MKTVVIEIGSARVSAGFAGEPAPRAVVTSPLEALLVGGKSGGGRTAEQVFAEHLGPLLSALFSGVLLCKPRAYRLMVRAGARCAWRDSTHNDVVLVFPR